VAFKPWLEHQLAHVSGKSGTAKKLHHDPNHWDGLVRFLDVGRLELDTNIVERGIRLMTLGGMGRRRPAIHRRTIYQRPSGLYFIDEYINKSKWIRDKVSFL
jgi:Transposase IS66 family